MQEDLRERRHACFFKAFRCRGRIGRMPKSEDCIGIILDTCGPEVWTNTRPACRQLSATPDSIRTILDRKPVNPELPAHTSRSPAAEAHIMKLASRLPSAPNPAQARIRWHSDFTFDSSLSLNIRPQLPNRPD